MMGFQNGVRSKARTEAEKYRGQALIILGALDNEEFLKNSVEAPEIDVAVRIVSSILAKMVMDEEHITLPFEY